MNTRHRSSLRRILRFFATAGATSAALLVLHATAAENVLKLQTDGHFEARGLDILVFNNTYDGAFSDAKISSVELIHHDVRTATNGDVRLSPTPGQWDPIPQILARKINPEEQSVDVLATYPDYDFQFIVRVQAHGDGVTISVLLGNALPPRLVGKAGFNLEFLPAAYFKKTFLMDGAGGLLPRYPASAMTIQNGVVEPKPIATGHSLVLAPEDPARRVTIQSADAELSLFDGRNQAQNGWYVVRSLIPAGHTGKVLTWSLSASMIPDWLRTPVIGHSQVGYRPDQAKTAVIELDRKDPLIAQARLLRLNERGDFEEKFAGEVKPWGPYLRYNYAKFDFSPVKTPGLYVIEYGKVRTRPFRIADDCLTEAWHPTLDVYLPIAMDHMAVREAYRVWHGHSHRDDALQAPVNHVHFDLYAQGPSTDTTFKPGQHIPGLDIGGWYDAGDFDIRTETQYAVILDLVHAWEDFKITRDVTSVDQARHLVNIHVPDGSPDLLQQIEHGTLALVAQYRAIGHAMNGIISSNLVQYRFLGDAASNSDNLIHNPALKPGESDGFTSGTDDDRWAFTSKSTPLDYGSIAALAAASRALRGFREALADECLTTAKRIWDDEHSHAPALFHHGNTTGGTLEDEELKAAVELLITTKDAKYAQRVEELWPAVEKTFELNAALAARAQPYLSAAFTDKLRARTKLYAEEVAALAKENPYGVPIWRGGWAGNGRIIDFAINNYLLNKIFPDLITGEAVQHSLDFLYGCHPGSDISFVSAVGTASKEIAYGNNRADFTFIAGGVVPGLLILNPEFPENKDDWPFLWGENEYVVNLGPAYIYLVNDAGSMKSPGAK